MIALLPWDIFHEKIFCCRMREGSACPQKRNFRELNRLFASHSILLLEEDYTGVG